MAVNGSCAPRSLSRRADSWVLLHPHLRRDLTRCREVWVLAQSPFQIDLPDSRVDMYVLISSTHDGSGAVTAAVTPVRVVCMNTLRAALSRAQASYRVRHTSGAQGRL